MPFRKMKGPKSEEKPKLGVGGVCHGDSVPPMYRSRPPLVKLVVQPLPATSVLMDKNVYHAVTCYTSDGVSLTYSSLSDRRRCRGRASPNVTLLRLESLIVAEQTRPCNQN